MQCYDELVARGLIAQVTNEEEIREMVNNGKATFYIGFDPTADSLHVGHFMALCLMKRLQMAGNKPIALIGGGRRSLRTYRHAPGDDGRDNSAQLRVLQTADEQVHRFFRWKGSHGKQCRMALKIKLCGASPGSRQLLFCQQHAACGVLQAADGKRVKFS